MLRLSILVLVLAGGCVAEGDGPTATIEIDTETSTHLRLDHAIDSVVDQEASTDLCAAAAELPATEVCSLICDPSAMAAYLVDEGMDGGTCYQLRCVLPGSENAVMVGVCLPPN